MFTWGPIRKCNVDMWQNGEVLEAMWVTSIDLHPQLYSKMGCEAFLNVGGGDSRT